MLEEIFLEMLRQLLSQTDCVESNISEIIAAQFVGPGDKEELLKIGQRRDEILSLFLEQKISKASYISEDKELQELLHEQERKYKEEIQVEKEKNAVLNILLQLQSGTSDKDLYGQFNREIFEFLVDRIIVGGRRDDGSEDPYRILIVLK